MRKHKIICPIRRANQYQKMLKASQENSVLPNLLNREFKQEVPGKVLLTDITYLYYGNGQKAFLSTIKDSSTNEILSYNVSSRMTLDLVTHTLVKLKRNNKVKFAKHPEHHCEDGKVFASTSHCFPNLFALYVIIVPNCDQDTSLMASYAQDNMIDITIDYFSTEENREERIVTEDMMSIAFGIISKTMFSMVLKMNALSATESKHAL